MVQLPAASLPLDVVTVPDFAGPNRDRFELRALLFLACWAEFAGRSREHPLHLACVGEPPASVHWLAARCGARLTVVAPLVDHGWRGLNKLRGLEIDAVAEQRLLLDTDVLPLSDFSGLLEAGPRLAAARAFRQRVDTARWPAVYAAVGMPTPSDPPYFNGGVVLVPRGCDLRDRWEAFARTIAVAFAAADEGRRELLESDQTSLAAAIVSLRDAGVPFSMLPAHYNAGWPHLYRREPPLAGVVLFHAVGLFGRTWRASRSVEWNVNRYTRQVLHRLLTAWRVDPDGGMSPRALRSRLVPSIADLAALRRRLLHACRAHVRPALDAVRR